MCLHGIVATRPRRHVADAGLLVKTCTVTVSCTTRGVLPEKETVSGPVGGVGGCVGVVGGCVGVVGDCVVMGDVGPVVVVGGSVVGRPVEVQY